MTQPIDETDVPTGNTSAVLDSCEMPGSTAATQESAGIAETPKALANPRKGPIDADLRELAETAPHTMWFSSARGGVIYFNARFFEYTRMPQAQALGMGWTAAVHPDDLAKCFQRRDRARAIRNHTPWVFESRFLRHDGQYRWHQVRNVPLFDTVGNVRRWVGSATDIHEEKEALKKQRRFLRDVLAAVTQGKLRLCETAADLPAPLLPRPVALDLPLSTASLAAFRQMVRAACSEACLPIERASDLIASASEAAMNAVVHGKGGIGRIYADKERGLVQLWVMDRGSGIGEDFLHRATLEPGFSSAGTLGQGFPLMIRFTDCVYLLTSATGGTTVVIEQGSAAS